MRQTEFYNCILEALGMPLEPMDTGGQWFVEMDDDGILPSSHVLLVEDNPVNQEVALPTFQTKSKEKLSLLLQEVQVDSPGCSSLDQYVLDEIGALDQPDVINYSTK